jgi:hypothetical protein
MKARIRRGRGCKSAIRLALENPDEETRFELAHAHPSWTALAQYFDQALSIVDQNSNPPTGANVAAAFRRMAGARQPVMPLPIPASDWASGPVRIQKPETPVFGTIRKKETP